MTDPTAQIDWIGLDDNRAAARLMLKQSAERIGIDELAHQLGEEPSTIRNQLERRDRKRPSADLADACWLLDPVYRRQMAGLCKETIQTPPDLTAEEALREIVAKAESSWDKRAVAEVLGVYKRVRR